MILESENMEFKRQLTDDIYKEVVAFANTDGGTIFIGIDDQGNAVGLDDVDETYTRITNGIRDAILPDVTLFVRFALQDNRIIKVEVCIIEVSVVIDIIIWIRNNFYGIISTSRHNLFNLPCSK